jgi:hypothetical protein
MAGFLVAMLYCVVIILSGHHFIDGFIGATKFLFWWYVIWVILLFVVVVSCAVLVMTAGILTGAGRKEKVVTVASVLFSLFGFSAVSLPFVFGLLFRRTLFILGSFLMNKSLIFTAGTLPGWSFDKPILIFGALMVLFALFYRTRFFIRLGRRIRSLYRGIGRS